MTPCKHVVEILEEALEFYANEDNHDYSDPEKVAMGHEGPTFMEEDRGKRAREALEKARAHRCGSNENGEKRD